MLECPIRKLAARRIGQRHRNVRGLRPHRRTRSSAAAHKHHHRRHRRKHQHTPVHPHTLPCERLSPTHKCASFILFLLASCFSIEGSGSRVCTYKPWTERG